MNSGKFPFTLEAGDILSLSVIRSKVCKDKESETKIRYVKIDEKCSEQETKHFAHVLNQEECQGSIQDGICLNKYIVGDAQWLNGKEYRDSNFSKLDQDENN